MPRQPCVELVAGEPCGRRKSKRSTIHCPWHWLLKQAPAVRDSNARHRADNLKQDPSAIQPGDKQCSVCEWFVPQFYMARGRRCVGCEGIARHEAHILRTYDLQRGDWAALNALQKGRCAVCRRKQVKKRLATDHDHPTDLVRGLLCDWCNQQVLGALGGDTEKALPLARALVYYLECHPSSGRWSPPEDQPEFGFPAPERKRLTNDQIYHGIPDTDPAEKALAPF